MLNNWKRGEIPAAACGDGLSWIDEHWPPGRETWTVSEALRAGCALQDALWLLGRRDAARSLITDFARECAERAARIAAIADDKYEARHSASVAAHYAKRAAETDNNTVAAAAAIYAAVNARRAAVAGMLPYWYQEHAWQKSRLAEMLEGTDND